MIRLGMVAGLAGCAGWGAAPWSEPPALERATPVYGGTMATDSARLVVADPVRDLVLFASQRNLHTDEPYITNPTPVQLAEGAEPFRVALGAERAFVTLRGAGQVVAFDKWGGELARQDVCAHPRGVAVDASTLYVACAGGRLVQLDPQSLEVRERTFLAPDLRDVVIDGDTVLVSRFRSARILRVDPILGEVVERLAPDAVGGGPAESRARVAWRMIPHPEGGAIVLHQLHVVRDLPDGGFSAPVRYYGWPEIEPIVTSHLTIIEADSSVSTSAPIRALGPVVDVAVDETGTHLAVAGAVAATQEWAVMELMAFSSTSVTRGPVNGEIVQRSPDAIASVAIPVQGLVRSYHRGVGKLVSYDELIEPPPWYQRRTSEENLFHLPGVSGVACVSCHPEGQDDGFTWHFSVDGERRTQNLAGGLRSRGSFHWEGGFPTLDDLMRGIFTGRMGGHDVPRGDVADLGAWLDAIPTIPATPDVAPEILARGEALFEDPAVGCAECHSGPQLADHQRHDIVGAFPTKTPSLRGVGTRAPYMHTGCASTLLERFTREACGGTDHGNVSALSDAELEALAAFVSTL